MVGTDVNAVDKTGLTPLAWAAAHRQVSWRSSGVTTSNTVRHREPMLLESHHKIAWNLTALLTLLPE